MIIHFDNERHLFSPPKCVNSSIATNIKDLLNEAIGENHGYSTGDQFNDLDFYMYLSNKKGCTKVEICKVRVTHTTEKATHQICHDIQATYKSTYSNGRTKMSIAPSHGFSTLSPHPIHSGYTQDSDFVLEDGEYLIEIFTRLSQFTCPIMNNRYVERITLVTNRRTAYFGEGKAVSINLSSTIRPPSTGRSQSRIRIIAFVGFGKVAVSIGMNWETIGHLICLRVLVEQKRAMASQDEGDEERVERFIMKTSEDIFRCILSFI